MYLSYVNHLGETIDFYGQSPYIMTEHSFFNWQLSYNTSNNRSSGYRLDGREFDFTVRIVPRHLNGRNRPQEYADLINRFVSVVSADTDTPGRMYAKSGEYLEGRIVVSDKTAWTIDKSVTLSCRFRADNPTWRTEHEHRFSIVEQAEYEFLCYPYEYAHDYAAMLPGYASIENNSTEASDYLMTIYGPASSPMVSLNGIQVGAAVALGANDRLVIDTGAKTVIKYTEAVAENVFNARYKGDVSMFTKLQPGSITAIWSGAFRFDLTILERRREPTWML